jgi:hypothetical protein
MFVARVEGRSMEPLIPDGSYRLFRAPALNSRTGDIIVAELHDDADPETGGSYTVKRLHQETRVLDGERVRIGSLQPLNPAFPPLTPRDGAGRGFRAVAHFIEVLRPAADAQDEPNSDTT